MWALVPWLIGCGSGNGEDRRPGDVADGDDTSATGDTAAPVEDLDGDGFTVTDGDCDDQDPTRFPGADEACDGLDSD